MEFFPVGTHVRLRSSNGRYLHALEDGLGTAMRRRRESLKAAWAVEHEVTPTTTYVLLRTAAYGSYLTLRTKNVAPAATRRVCEAVLQDYDDLDQGRELHWTIVLRDETNREIHLRHRKLGIWYSPGNANLSKSWVVEAIPPRFFAPELPPVVQPVMRRVGRRVYPAAVEWRRIIRYSRVDLNGKMVDKKWKRFWFEGKSVSSLRNTLAARVGEQNPESIMLCVRAAKFGVRNPLVVDLPANENTMDIYIYTTGSPGAARLRHPNVDAPAPAAAPPPAAAALAPPPP